MKYLLLILTLFFSAFKASAEIRPGDLILISLNCYSCPIIESETNSPYSHSGLLVQENGDWFVLEALAKVQKTPLAKFKQYVRPGTQPHYYRLKEWAFEDPTRNQKLLLEFKNRFEGLPFDSLYLWDNYNSQNQELLYCSEMITKLLNQFLTNPIPTDPMDFTNNWEYWEKVYKGNVPQGEPGNSPATFADPSLTFRVTD